MNLEFSGELWFWKGPAPHSGQVRRAEAIELGDHVTVSLIVGSDR